MKLDRAEGFLISLGPMGHWCGHEFLGVGSKWVFNDHLRLSNINKELLHILDYFESRWAI